MKGKYAHTHDPFPSATRRNILDFVTDFIGARGYSPSYREIKEAVGLKSTAAVQRHIMALCDDGFLTNTSNHYRALKLAM